ncbi:MAG: long-chain-fatty-acid--CoA ligase [Candidatus Hydrogenedentes bacterium]|nr:long-chain-fatty-acid--CoA ligase [Candidatus Hydrogenedentota bacterium]
MTITHLLEERACSLKDKAFLICDGEEYSYTLVNEMANRVAVNLAARGVKKGDKVLIVLGNCVEFVYLMLGLGRIGALMVPVNPLLKPQEIAYILDNSDAETLVTLADFAPLCEHAKKLVPRLKHIFITGDGAEGLDCFDVLLEPVSEFPAIPITAEDEAAIIYTSGTTGTPKGVVLTHRNYLSNTRMLMHVIPMAPDDRFLMVLPLFHVNAQLTSVLVPLSAGATVIMTRKFAPLSILPFIEKYRATVMSAVPTIYMVMCRMMQAEPRDISSIRLFASGAAPLPESIYLATQEILKKPLIMGYGLTEATCASAVADYRDPIRWDSVGPPLRYTSIRIVGDDGFEVPVGEVGEILIAGPTVMKGYYKDPEATAEVLKGGWLHTGDLGRFDEDGYLYIVGRLKDMIIRGGQNIYPAQVENVLSVMPGVEECCVVGVHEERWGQEVLAVVKRANGSALSEQDVIEYCRQHLATYKCPRFVEFMDELPKTATGKIKKPEIAEMFADLVSRRKPS